MSYGLPDVQASSPDVTVGLNRVGITDVEKRVSIAPGEDGDRPLTLLATFSAFVDLPGWRKGADMSRNMEVIDETIEATLEEPAFRVEALCGDVAERLLDRHEYTTRTEIRMKADLVLDDRTPESDRTSQYTAEVTAGASATEAGTTEEIGARVTGMTVCPCSQGMSAARARTTLAELGVGETVVEQFLEAVPQPGHAQRGHATLAIETEGEPNVDLLDVIDVARDSMSARLYNLAKRPDEDHMTYQSHANAKFVEDCVRDMAAGCVARFEDLPDEAVVRMKQSNDESIHQHDVQAERAATIQTLRKELAGDGEPLPAADD